MINFLSKMFKKQQKKENIIDQIYIRVIEHKIGENIVRNLKIGIGESLSLYNPGEKEHEIFKLIYTPNKLFLETFSEGYIKELKK